MRCFQGDIRPSQVILEVLLEISFFPVNQKLDKKKITKKNTKSDSQSIFQKHCVKVPKYKKVDIEDTEGLKHRATLNMSHR